MAPFTMSLSTYHPLPYMPAEVVAKILAFLEIKELVACQCVSTTFRSSVMRIRLC
jgi:hypothetical protein